MQSNPCPMSPTEQAEKTKAKPARRPAYWTARLPSSVFPRGPRALYCYLAAFPKGACCLFNYRLASKFGVSVRTIRRWRSWLKQHQLIHTWWETPRKPRIIVHRYNKFSQWLTAMALPAKRSKIPADQLSQDEKSQRIREFKRAFLSFP